MALRDNPFIHLYVQDFMADEKLAMCSASANGVYIRLMCILHKSANYGMFILKDDISSKIQANTLAKSKQNPSKSSSKILAKEEICQSFATRLIRLMPYSLEEITNGLVELVEEGVIIIDDNVLYQPRMVKDAEISDTRSRNGLLGGKQKAENLAKSKQNSSKSSSKTLAKVLAKSKLARACADNDNDNNIYIDKKEEKGLEKEEKEDEVYICEQSLFEDMRKNRSWQEQAICMKYHITADDCLKLIDDFELDCKCQNMVHVDLNDIYRHFANWLKIQKHVQSKANPTNGQDKRRGTYEVATTDENWEGSF